MITAELGDITEAKTDVIVNAANGVGIMGGGVAGALRRAAGMEVQEEAKGLCSSLGNVEAGDCYATGSGKLAENNVKAIYHAVTMKYPGDFSSMDVIAKAVRKVLQVAIASKMESIAIPGLGTGIGRLDKKLVAQTLVNTVKDFDGLISIRFIDLDESFIRELKVYMQCKGVNYDNENAEQSDAST